MRAGEIRRHCFQCGKFIWWIAVLSCQIIGIGCVIKAGVIFDEEFMVNCIEDTDVGIGKPAVEEFSALLWLSVIGIVTFCCGSCIACVIYVLCERCCYNNEQDVVKQIMTMLSVIDATGFAVLFFHLYIYLTVLQNALQDQFDSQGCINNEQFNSAINWSKAGLIVSCTITFIICCNGYLLYRRSRAMRSYRSKYRNPSHQHKTDDIEAQQIRGSKNQKLQNLLIGLDYKYKDDVINEVANVLDKIELCSLTPCVEYKIQRLLKLKGTIPIQYKSTQYNTPVVIWITIDFPFTPPICYVECMDGMKIAEDHQNVDDKGLVYHHPYLNSWKQQKQGSLEELIAKLGICFSERHPLYTSGDDNNDDEIIVPIQVNGLFDAKKYDFDPFSVTMRYSKDTISDLIQKATQIINKKYYPVMYCIFETSESSFFGKKPIKYDLLHGTELSKINAFGNCEWQSWCSITKLSKYIKTEIIEKGIMCNIKIEYHHKPFSADIACEYIQKSDVCPIYSVMMKNQGFTEDGLRHLCDFSHFKDEYKEKKVCIKNQECESFIRIKNGGYLLVDQCHIHLYRHPPRTDRQIKMEKNMNIFILNTSENENYRTYNPTEEERKQYEWNETDGYIHALIEEVIENGYAEDLALTEDDLNNQNWSILTVVDSKLQHFRHKAMDSPLNRAEMLALILYTGGKCNYDLCASQRKKNYDKWKWFDLCLFWAISDLSKRETGDYKLYSGLNQVNLNKTEIKHAFFPTYTSTSWRKEVAFQFMQGKGMVIEFDKNYRNDDLVSCCDVSWISKFPQECEVLIARNTHINDWSFKIRISDQTSEIQTVSLVQSMT